MHHPVKLKKKKKKKKEKYLLHGHALLIEGIL